MLDIDKKGGTPYWYIYWGFTYSNVIHLTHYRDLQIDIVNEKFLYFKSTMEYSTLMEIIGGFLVTVEFSISHLLEIID